MGEEIEKSIRNLKQYIKEDPYFNRTSKIETDFDKFCYNHCKDIENLLEENKIQRKQLNDAFNNGWIHKSKVREKIEILDNIIDRLDTELAEAYIVREKLGTEEQIDNNEQYIYNMEQERSIRHTEKYAYLKLLQEGDDK